MRKSVSNRSKREIFSFILDQEDPFKADDYGGIVEFLNTVWDLRSMSSEDNRFQNAEEDVIQHTINNDDWSMEYLFKERLGLFEKGDTFISFIEAVVSPNFRSSKDEILQFVIRINNLLEKDKLQLSLSEYNDADYPIYTVNEVDESNQFPINIKPNTISFFVKKTRNRGLYLRGGHEVPQVFPSIILVFNDQWNDYGIKSEFMMYYYDQNKNYHTIGAVKIINREGSASDMIPDEFIQLDEKFCSLGQTREYYEILNDLLGKDFIGTLYALRDAAFFSEIQEEFEKTEEFKRSLIRYDEQERLLREAKHWINGGEIGELYSFEYKFKPKFSDGDINVRFNFGEAKESTNRVYALIGENGTGKTQLLTSLPIKIAESKDEFFIPKTPLFSKIIAVSYSVFDTFETPKKTIVFNYVYCGLRNEKGELLSEDDLLIRFHHTCARIQKMERTAKWRKVLLNFLDQELVDELIVLSEEHERYNVPFERIDSVRNKLSSGQSILLYIISQIVAHIRYDSLLLFDEPETHLHPNAISQLMNTIYSVVEEFQSYCILATHSPLVIRECFSRNVYVMERNLNFLSVRKIPMESFGENLSLLSDEVFGNKEIPKYYKKFIREQVDKGMLYNDIVAHIESDGVPLGLNAKIYIKSIIKTQNA